MCATYANELENWHRSCTSMPIRTQYWKTAGLFTLSTVIPLATVIPTLSELPWPGYRTTVASSTVSIMFATQSRPPSMPLLVKSCSTWLIRPNPWYSHTRRRLVTCSPRWRTCRPPWPSTCVTPRTSSASSRSYGAPITSMTPKTSISGLLNGRCLRTPDAPVKVPRTWLSSTRKASGWGAVMSGWLLTGHLSASPAEMRLSSSSCAHLFPSTRTTLARS